MNQEEEIVHLKERLSEVVEQLSKSQEQASHLLEQMSMVQAENHVLKEQLAEAHKRIEELEKQKTPVPDIVKANVVKPKADAKKERKKRDPKDNHGRRRQEPTRVVEHGIKGFQ